MVNLKSKTRCPKCKMLYWKKHNCSLDKKDKKIDKVDERIEKIEKVIKFFIGLFTFCAVVCFILWWRTR